MNPMMMGGGFQTLGSGGDNPLAQALMAFKNQMSGPQPTTTTPPPQPADGGMDASDKASMVGDYIDGSGIAGVAAQIGETLVNKKAAEIAERGGDLTKREERLLKLKGYKVDKPKPMGAQGGAVLVGEPGSGVELA